MRDPRDVADEQCAPGDPMHEWSALDQPQTPRRPNREEDVDDRIEYADYVLPLHTPDLVGVHGAWYVREAVGEGSGEGCGAHDDRGRDVDGGEDPARRALQNVLCPAQALRTQHLVRIRDDRLHLVSHLDHASGAPLFEPGKELKRELDVAQLEQHAGDELDEAVYPLAQLLARWEAAARPAPEATAAAGRRLVGPVETVDRVSVCIDVVCLDADDELNGAQVVGKEAVELLHLLAHMARVRRVDEVVHCEEEHV